MNKHAPHPFEAKLNRVLDRMGGLYLASDLISDVMAGKKQMFCLNDSIAVTQITNFPRAKVLDIIVVVGDVDELRELHERLMKFAEEVGCSVIQAYGRRGWVKDATSRGWKVKSRAFVYQKEL
jgi:hypothetical protein